MFEHFDEHYARYCEYIKTEQAMCNCSENRYGFTSNEVFESFVYGKPFKYNYQLRYVEKEDKFVVDKKNIESIDRFYDKNNEYNDPYLGNYQKKEFSVVDTLNKMGHYASFNYIYYILCDNYMISINKISAVRQFSKITSINVDVDDDRYIDEIEQFVNDNVVAAPKPSKEKRFVHIASASSRGIMTTPIEAKPFDCDVKLNYNDDLPYDRIQEMINSKDEHLILLHGEPGTGKTSIIKKLINDNPDVTFIYLDFKLLSSFSDASVFDFLMQNKNKVFIIEDCEKLFTDRNNGNQYINSMLNLTDGIIGEAFGIKFICTFNCPPSKIDKAVLREGRLSLMYEFKKLSLEKTRVFEPDATEPKTLAEVYCKGDNGAETVNKKIGFQ